MKLSARLKKVYDRVIYANDPELLYHPQHRSHELLNFECLVGSIGVTLVQGTFQSGFLIESGATDTALAFAAMLATITGIIAPFGGMVFSRMPKRRWLILTSFLVARLLLASIVYVPLVIPRESAACVPVMLAFISVAGVLNSIGNVGYEIWMAAVVPPNIRGRYTAARNTLTNAIVPFCSLMAAAYLDNAAQRNTAFLILFSIGAVFIVGEAIIISRTPEPEYETQKGKHVDLKATLRQLWAAKPYLRLVLNLFIFYLTLYISASFHSVYLMKYHNFSYTLMTLITIGYTFLQLVQYRFWGKMCDRIGSRRLVYISFCLFILESCVWIFVPAHLVKYLFFIFYIFSSMANCSLGIALFPRKYELMPQDNQPLYVGVYTAVVAIAALIGPSIGTAIKDFAEAHMTQAMLDNMWNMRILWVVTVAAQILHRLGILLVRRKPEV